jgi:hypothetical protein
MLVFLVVVGGVIDETSIRTVAFTSSVVVVCLGAIKGDSDRSKSNESLFFRLLQKINKVLEVVSKRLRKEGNGVHDLDAGRRDRIRLHTK